MNTIYKKYIRNTYKYIYIHANTYKYIKQHKTNNLNIAMPATTTTNRSPKVKTKQQHLLTSQRQVPPPPIPKRQNISKSENTDIDIMNQ